MNKKPIIIGCIAALIIAAGGLALLLSGNSYSLTPTTPEETRAAVDVLKRSMTTSRTMYVDFLREYENAPRGASPSEARLSGSADTSTIGMYETAVFTVDVPSAGLYSIKASCELLVETLVSPLLNVTINGVELYQESNSITVPLLWADSTKDFPLDSYGDETLPSIVNMRNGVFEFDFYNSSYISDTPLLFYFETGVNEVALMNLSSAQLRIDSLTLMPQVTDISYAEYIAQHAGAPMGTLTSEQGQYYSTKNNTLVQLFSERNAAIKPNSVVDKHINTLDVGTEPGQEVTFNINVPSDGLYHFALQGRTGNDDFPVFYTLSIDGEVPFAECRSYPVPAVQGSTWHNIVLGENENNPYSFYLTKGNHEFTLRSENEVVAESLRNLQLIVDHINWFNLEIVKITGKDIDKNRTWRFTRYIPETSEYLEAYDTILRGILTNLGPYSPKNENTAMLSNVTQALALLDAVREDPDDLPINLASLSGTSSSVLQLAGDQLDNLTHSYMGISEIYLYGNEKLPRGTATAMESLSMTVGRLVGSYTQPKYSVKNQPEDLNIWVKRSIVELDLIQKLVDSRYIGEGKPKVNLSVMPAEDTLVLAAAAGTQPDMAMGVPSHIPYELSVRDALYDMTSFNDFWDVATRMPAGGIVTYVFNERVYALPETIDFYALAYRTDIFESLSLDPPDTWDDLCDIMPTLQRYGMSFYHPIATNDSYKWYHQTTPLIMQYGGKMFSTDGLRSTIDEPAAVKGLTLLTDLFTMYSLETSIPVFTSAFRNGSVPIGIVSRADYITMKNAAPEIAGQWKLTNYPGTVQEDGSVARWFVQAADCLFIFKETDKPDMAWDFIKWWTSAPAQKEYAINLRTTYGPSMLWLSSNIEALADSPIDDEDKRVILDQMQWLTGVPRSPGSYLLERTLSDIWNDSVFKGTPTRIAIDKRVMSVQREMRRKMAEFGFVNAMGEPIKDYAVYGIEWVLEMFEKHDKGGGA